jgi:hypothetical protein
VNLSDVLNGAGPFAAVGALPMLLSLFLREGSMARTLRRMAIFLAVALPTTFMVLVGLSYLSQPGKVFFDFTVNYDAAQFLYAQNDDPYAVHAAYSFPFPTFYLYWLGSLFGRFSQSVAWIVWWFINVFLWVTCAVLLWRILPPAGSQRRREILLYVTVAIPAVVTLWQGQTALFVLLGLVALQLAAVRESAHRDWIIGGIGLAFAALIKPQSALVGIGIVIWAIVAYRENRRIVAQKAAWIIGSAVTVALLLITLTLILPGGVSLDTYQRFVSEVLPQIARPEDNITVIGSPSFIAALLALKANASSTAANLIGTFVTLIMLIVAIFWTIQRRHHSLAEITAGWAVWAMVALRITWTWYAAWCLPFFLLASHEAVQNQQSLRLALFVLLLALLNMQISNTLIAFLTISLLITLLWTSFHERKTHETLRKEQL